MDPLNYANMPPERTEDCSKTVRPGATSQSLNCKGLAVIIGLLATIGAPAAFDLNAKIAHTAAADRLASSEWPLIPKAPELASRCDDDEVLCASSVTAAPEETLIRVAAAIPPGKATLYRVRVTVVPIEWPADGEVQPGPLIVDETKDPDS